MAKGSSGRIVVEIDPKLKQDLYHALGMDGVNMKQWFLNNVCEYLNNHAHSASPSISPDIHNNESR